MPCGVQCTSVKDARAECLPEIIGREYSTERLRKSLRTVGPKFPALYFAGECIDGRRRLQLARSLRIDVPVLDIPTRLQAARELWVLHPRRAYELFAPPRARISELLFLFDCDASELPNPNTAWAKTRRGPRNVKGTSNAVTPAVVVPRDLLRSAQAVCKSRGISMSAAIRGLVEYLAQSSTD